MKMRVLAVELDVQRIAEECETRRVYIGKRITNARRRKLLVAAILNRLDGLG